MPEPAARTPPTQRSILQPSNRGLLLPPLQTSGNVFVGGREATDTPEKAPTHPRAPFQDLSPNTPQPFARSQFGHEATPPPPRRPSAPFSYTTPSPPAPARRPAPAGCSRRHRRAPHLLPSHGEGSGRRSHAAARGHPAPGNGGRRSPTRRAGAPRVRGGRPPPARGSGRPGGEVRSEPGPAHRPRPPGPARPAPSRAPLALAPVVSVRDRLPLPPGQRGVRRPRGGAGGRGSGGGWKAGAARPVPAAPGAARRRRSVSAGAKLRPAPAPPARTEGVTSAARPHRLPRRHLEWGRGEGRC